ncbi:MULTISPECIES: hypothetical protein [Enterobacter]|uniref:hypothetical protein n=1 Tax=Enterobacter TaxID=547 RepID=UPI0021D17D01|nr:hypothetical protein [Enterobacter quasiroggenkampii]MCU6406615.1 hypothetical protein [Enterobacter quasiroggenkampii]
MVNPQSFRNRAKAIMVKQCIAEYCDNQKMMEEVKTEKMKLITEAAFNDTVIRARINYLLQQH